MKKIIWFIINPISGVGKQMAAEKAIHRYLDTSKYDYQLKYTQFAGHASVLVSEALTQKVDILVAVGGDGSINEMAKNMLNSSVSLAILPCGSGNGFATHLGISKNFKRALESINQGRVKAVDTISVNENLIVNVGGIGFDAAVSVAFAKGKSRGLKGYLLAVIDQLFKYKVREYEVILDEKVMKVNPLLIAFANASQYGNNLVVNPSAEIEDGYFELCMHTKFPKFLFPFLLVLLLLRRLNWSPYMTIIKTKHCVVKHHDDCIHCDGEVVKVSGSLSLKINPKSLNVIY